MICYWIFKKEYREEMKDFAIALTLAIIVGILEVCASKTISEIYGCSQKETLIKIIMIVNMIMLIISVAIYIWYKRKLKEQKEISRRKIVILQKYDKMITEDNCIEMNKKCNEEIEAMKREVKHSRL